MQRISPPFAALLALALSACEREVSPSSTVVPSAPVQVVRAEFGLFNRAENGRTIFVPSRTVPLTLEQTYGWVVTLKTARSRIKWREEFTLPSAPETWGGQSAGAHTVSQDRTVSVTEREVEPDQGVIFNAWSVADSDPKGRYVIRLTIENASPIVFEFHVE